MQKIPKPLLKAMLKVSAYRMKQQEKKRFQAAVLRIVRYSGIFATRKGKAKDICWIFMRIVRDRRELRLSFIFMAEDCFAVTRSGEKPFAVHWQRKEILSCQSITA